MVNKNSDFFGGVQEEAKQKLETFEANKEEPKKTNKLNSRTTFRMPEELHKKIDKYCYENKISINSFLLEAVEKHASDEGI